MYVRQHGTSDETETLSCEAEKPLRLRMGRCHSSGNEGGQLLSVQLLYAFDPGGTTGIAVFHDAELKLVYGLATKYRLAWLHTWALNLHQEDVVVVEDYTGAGRLSTYGKDTIKLIGILEYLCLEATGHTPVYQRNQVRTPPFLEQAKVALRALSERPKRIEQHHIDAVAHGLVYLERKKHHDP